MVCVIGAEPEQVRGAAGEADQPGRSPRRAGRPARVDLPGRGHPQPVAGDHHARARTPGSPDEVVEQPVQLPLRGTRVTRAPPGGAVSGSAARRLAHACSSLARRRRCRLTGRPRMLATAPARSFRGGWPLVAASRNAPPRGRRGARRRVAAAAPWQVGRGSLTPPPPRRGSRPPAAPRPGGSPDAGGALAAAVSSAGATGRVLGRGHAQLGRGCACGPAGAGRRRTAVGALGRRRVRARSRAGGRTPSARAGAARAVRGVPRTAASAGAVADSGFRPPGASRRCAGAAADCRGPSPARAGRRPTAAARARRRTARRAGPRGRHARTRRGGQRDPDAVARPRAGTPRAGRAAATPRSTSCGSARISLAAARSSGGIPTPQSSTVSTQPSAIASGAAGRGSSRSCPAARTGRRSRSARPAGASGR